MADDGACAALACEILACVLPMLVAPVDAFVLARALSMRLRPTVEPGAVLDGLVIRYDGTAPVEQQQWLVAEAVAEHSLRARGLPFTRDAKRAVARTWIAR